MIKRYISSNVSLYSIMYRECLDNQERKIQLLCKTKIT